MWLTVAVALTVSFVTGAARSQGEAGSAARSGYELIGDLLADDREIRESAVAELSRRGDKTLLAGLNDVHSFFRRVDSARADVVARLMQDIAGEVMDDPSSGWTEWIGRHKSIEPKEGYLALKGAVFNLYDRSFVDFLNPTVRFRIRPEEIEWGGVKKDGIPALDYPRTVAANEADYLRGDDRVFGLSLNGEARAYPHRIMDWHEMANDFVGGVPVTLSYCTLCGSGILFDARVNDRDVFTFGSSGLLYRSNKLMYDRNTGALWSNLTGEPVSTDLIDAGIVLKRLPLVVSTWNDWVARHPDTRVLDENTGYERDYRQSPYETYFDSDELMFPVWLASDRMKAKAPVFALIVNGQPKAYPVDVVQKEGIVHDVVRGKELVLVSEGARGPIRAYASGGRRFEQAADGGLVEAGSGARWTVTEDALVTGSPGEGPGEADAVRLSRLPGHRAFWFGWYAFFPTTALYEANE